MIRILVADDHAMIRDGLRAAFSTREDLAIVGEAADGAEAVALAESLRPDVVVMDLHMPVLGGVAATRRILEVAPEVRVLVLTMQAEDSAVVDALRAGARGYLLKDAGREEIERAIRTVAADGTVLGAAVSVALLMGGEARRVGPFPGLSPGERDVLELIAQGRSNEDIARALFLSEKTIRNRVSAVYLKLEVDGRSQAIVAAREAGLGTS